MTLSNGCLHQKSPPPLNLFSLSSQAQLHFHLREDSLYELNEEHFKDKMNQPLTLLYLPLSVFLSLRLSIGSTLCP